MENAIRLHARDSWSPGVIRGVNLGGWLVTEEWITPGIYDGRADDEWHLCAALGKDRCLSTLSDHWDSFITRDDIEDIKAAGLNSLRIPVGCWAVDVQADEPYVSGQYPYLIRAVQWAQELGLTVLVDLHGAPGSQNGFDHSGFIGSVGFADNTTNVDRTIAVLRNFTEEFSKPEYGGTVTGIELLNEPRLGGEFTMNVLKGFYERSAETIQSVNGNMNVTAHDAFWGVDYWRDYTPFPSSSPSNRFIIDTHQYYAFAPLNNLPHDTIIDHVCNTSQMLKVDQQSTGLPPVIVGEWSLETGRPPSTEDPRGRSTRVNSQQLRTWYRLLFEAQLAAYSPNGPGQASIGWYYWTWKTEWDIDTWSYRRGLRDGYIPSDVSNASSLFFPILDGGCVDAGFNYTAPRYPGSAMFSATMDGSLLVSIVGLACIFMFLGR